MNVREIIAKNISSLRKREKMTQAQLAEKLHYSDKAISKWERGDSLPDAEMLYEISKFFNVSIEYLFETHEYEGISNETLLEIKKRQRNFIILLSTFATIIILSIVAMAITAINTELEIPHPIISFVLYALGVVAFFFGGLFYILGYKKFFSPSFSISIWLIVTGSYVLFLEYKPDYIFLIAIILQILILVSPKIYDAIPAKTISILKKRHEIKKEKKKNKKENNEIKK